MADRLVLDAMINRSDFWLKSSNRDKESSMSATFAQSITFENLRPDSNFVLSLRKPDFQRETNQWTVQQAVSFIQSFVDGELVPSVILWQSDDGYIFAIDGAHRLSALRAWIEDDYGDGSISIAFFGGEIPEGQKKAARAMRSKVEKNIGSYKSLRDKLTARAANPDIDIDDRTKKRLKHLGSRQLELQWVTGDADIAETSFFKINTQGTPLDKTEEDLLRNRTKAPAIAARSIVRAATGHKYWSKFDSTTQEKIEKLSYDANQLLFHPNLSDPIKTLQLPLGGSSSNLEALNILLKFISITDSTLASKRPALINCDNDTNGEATIKTLENTLSTLKRITGNDAQSLGLHPIVYFYSDRGKYLADLFLGISYLIKLKLINNDNNFFKKFTQARPQIEDFLIKNKPVISQILSQIYSRSRIERVGDIFTYLVENSQNGLSIEGVAKAANLKGSIVEVTEKVQGKSFTDTSKSSIYIRQAISSALKCPICNGYIEPALSASYDHISRKSDGGNAESENGQICHPYCNTGIKA